MHPRHHDVARLEVELVGEGDPRLADVGRAVTRLRPPLGTDGEDLAIHGLAGPVGALFHRGVEHADAVFAGRSAYTPDDVEHPGVADGDRKRRQERFVSDDALLQLHGDDCGVLGNDQCAETVQ